MVWDSDAGPERLEVGVEPQKGMVAHGGVVWPLSHRAKFPQRQAAAPSSPSPLRLTTGSIFYRIQEGCPGSSLGAH